MNIQFWKETHNKNVAELLLTEQDIFVGIIFENDIQRANILVLLKDKLGVSISGSSLWTIKLRNGNIVKLVPLRQSQIELKGYTISLLLFPSSIEYNVRRRITRELNPQFTRYGGNVGIINI